MRSVSVEDSAHGRFSNKPNPDHQLVSDASLDILESVARDKIEEWAKGDGGGRLSEHPRLIYILYRWVEWRNRDTVEDYILNRLSDANFVELIVRLAENVGQAGFDTRLSLDHDNIRTLVNPDKALRRISNILNGPDISWLTPTLQEKLRELEHPTVDSGQVGHEAAKRTTDNSAQQFADKPAATGD